MIRKLLCWLGFHDFIDCCNDGKCFLSAGFVNGDCYNCEFGHGQNIVCKHCGVNKSLSEEHRINYNLIKENKELKAKVHILNMANQNLENNCFKALEYYNKVNINCNYPNKVSQLKSYIKRLIEEREELKKQLEMLLNPENVTENVANHEMQHCEKRIDE